MVNIEQTKEWAQAASEIYNMPFSPTNIKYQIKGLQSIHEKMQEEIDTDTFLSCVDDASYKVPSLKDFFNYLNDEYTCSFTEIAGLLTDNTRWLRITSFLSDESEENKKRKSYYISYSSDCIFDDDYFNLRHARISGSDIDYVDKTLLRFYRFNRTNPHQLKILFKLRKNYTCDMKVSIYDYMSFYVLFFTIYGAFNSIYENAVNMGIIKRTNNRKRQNGESLDAFIERINNDEKLFEKSHPCKDIDINSPELTDLEHRILDYLSGINGEVDSLTGIESFRYETKYDIAMACRQLKHNKLIIAFIDGDYSTGEIEASALEITDAGRNVLKRCSSNYRLQNSLKANDLIKQDMIPDSFVVSEDTLKLMPEMILSFHKVPRQRTMQYYDKRGLLWKLHKTFELVPASDYVTITNIYSQFINQQNEYIITTPNFVNYILPYIIDCSQDKSSAVQQGINRQIKKPDNEKIARRVRELMESCIH